MMEEQYKNEYDNPYRMLAASIATHMPVADVRRMLSEKDYIRQLVQAEVTAWQFNLPVLV